MIECLNAATFYFLEQAQQNARCRFSIAECAVAPLNSNPVVRRERIEIFLPRCRKKAPCKAECTQPRHLINGYPTPLKTLGKKAPIEQLLVRNEDCTGLREQLRNKRQHLVLIWGGEHFSIRDACQLLDKWRNELVRIDERFDTFGDHTTANDNAADLDDAMLDRVRTCSLNIGDDICRIPERLHQF
ncbi:hypothetical protein HRbin20_01276 [bacterium HR20]|nr:hypothetical protein HRbin20_01276 [bacterium HR20]